MYAALTVRKLKPGRFGDWRKAWEPDEWPDTVTKAYILRRMDDPDEVIAFGLSDVRLDELTALQDDPEFREAEERRSERMAPHVDSEPVSGFYEVVEIVHPIAAAH